MGYRLSTSSFFYCCISISAMIPRLDFGTKRGLDTDIGRLVFWSESSEEVSSNKDNLSLDKELPLEHDE